MSARASIKQPLIPKIPYPPLPSRRMERRLLERRRRRRRLLGWGLTLTAAIAIGLLLRAYVFTFARVEGASMTPTLQDGQYVLVDRLGLRLWPVRRQDVVLLKPEGEAHTLVKRVVGLGGDQVEWVNGRLLINGSPLKEPYVQNADDTHFPAVFVPQGMVYVLGDNRANSRDSRVMGCIPARLLIGRAAAACWPPGQMRALGGYAQ